MVKAAAVVLVALAFGTTTAPSASADSSLTDCYYVNLPPLPYLGNQMSFTVCPPGVTG